MNRSNKKWRIPNLLCLDAYGIAKSVKRFPENPMIALTMHQIPAICRRAESMAGLHSLPGCSAVRQWMLKLYMSSTLHDSFVNILDTFHNNKIKITKRFQLSEDDYYSLVRCSTTIVVDHIKTNLMRKLQMQKKEREKETKEDIERVTERGSPLKRPKMTR